MFLSYIHCFRALAITYIVIGHCIDNYVWPSGSIEERWLRVLFENGTVLFVFIGGYLFQHLSGSFEPKKFYLSKLKNVIIPYIIMSIPAIAIFVSVMERETAWAGFYLNSIWEQIGLFYITGIHLAPYWFIPMIVLFFACAPLLIMSGRSNIIFYSLPVLILVSVFVHRGLPIENFVHFMSAYVLGMFFSKFKNEINPVFSKFVPLILIFTLALLLAAYEFYTMKGTMTYVNYLQKLVISVFYLGLLVKFKEHLNSKIVSRIADASFGIFFIHSYFLTAGKMLVTKFSGQLPGGSLYLVILACLVTLGFCVGIVMLLQHLLGKRSRFLVGC